MKTLGYWFARFVVALCILIGVPGCGGSVATGESTRAPTCLASTYEAGGHRDACGSASVNPIVLECDAPPTAASIARYIGGGSDCSRGAVPNTMCCVPKAASAQPVAWIACSSTDGDSPLCQPGAHVTRCDGPPTNPAPVNCELAAPDAQSAVTVWCCK